MQWLDALLAQEAAAVLVTVVRAEGSVPRAAGARMLVTPHAAFDTIGGGHLEQSAIDEARRLLAAGPACLTRRFALGPSLGQCCGGVVYLAFEIVQAGDMPLYRRLRCCLDEGSTSWRLRRLDDCGSPHVLLDQEGKVLYGAQGPAWTDTLREDGTRVLAIDGADWLIDRVAPAPNHLYLFGAGHVGAAMVRALAPLPCRITWVDEREDMFPPHLPPSVCREVTDTPEAVVAGAQDGASFLVMTHSHALDQRLAEAILHHASAGWFGLIGSRTKRLQFERRLLARGVSRERLTFMTCPIGVPGIRGKEPAVIAVSVAAQLMQVWENASRAATRQSEILSLQKISA